MEGVKANIAAKTKEENKIENCSRLDFDCYLDGNATLVKKQHGHMDGRGAMDKGLMLQ